jgi:Large polyvalent protein associated domain 38/phage-Barnase-EndoU-ColicinE5/D-RelE like nuclease3
MTPELAAAIMRIKMPATVDTVRAAVRDLVGGLGTLPNRLGRVVVATSAEIRQTWEPLIGPVAMEAAGDTGRAQGFYDPKTKTVFLIADHIQRGQEAGVVAHELMHKHGEAVLGAEGWQQLHGMIEGWARAPEGSTEQRVYSEAQARVQSSMPEGAQQLQYSSQELFPYAVQVALEMGVRPNLLAKPGTVARWLGQVRAALRQVWAKITGKPGQFEAQDMVNLAFGIAQRENPEHAGELDGAIAGMRREIRAVIDAARGPGHAPQKAVLGQAADWLVQGAATRGLDIEGFNHVLDGSAVRHMIKNHYEAKGEKSRGQIALSDSDLLALPDVVQNPDRVVLGTQNRLGKEQIAYIKQLPDGSTLYLEEVRTGRKELAAVTARKYPATMNVESIVSTLHPNAQGDGGNGLIVLRSPAAGNSGPAGPMFSRAATATITDNYNPLQKQAAEKAFGAVAKQTVAERAKEMRSNLGTKLRQGLVDQFAPIKEVSMHAYMLARLSKASDGAVEAALLYGKPFLRDGVTDVDIKDGGFAKVLASLKGEHDRFFQWVAALRAERLKAEGKENLLTDQDISALKSLNAGSFQDGTPRMPAYAAALRELNAFNEAGLKIAKESGLIDQAAMDLMKDQPYVPFYRLMEDGDIKGARFSSGLINQQAFKKLKGGTQQINADLLQNTLLNWSHLYAAAARNRAALATMKDAEGMGVAYQVSADTKGAVKVMRDGVTEHWMIEDPYLLDAVSALHYTPSKLAQGMAPFKRLLTMGVTINPTFKIRNLIRDSLSAMAQSDLGYNPFANVAQGWKAMDKNSQTQASMLASGGIIKFGTQEDTGALRRKIDKLGGTMLDKDGFGKLKSQMASLWEAYEEFGDRTENANRAALYERLIAKGHSHAEASFMARDLMDFSMSGKWEMVRFLTQTVPFLNARMQGLYKLGRAAAEDPKRFGAIAGAVSLASLGLMAAYQDDEDWKKRDDWDRDSYWWFKIGNQAFRIPKPFEVGSIGTLAERTAELMLSKEMTGKRFGERLSDMIFNTFAMDPTPQAVKPLLDVYANKDSFSGKAIEGFADERLRPQDRYSDRTSEVARLLGSWGLPDPVKLAKGDYSALSPKQIDFLMRGYTGWLSTVFTTATDTVLRPMMGRGDRPEMQMRDVFLAGNFVESLPTNSSRYVSTMYDQAREISQVWASYQAAVKSGDVEGAAKIRAANPEALAKRIPVEAAKTRVAELSQQAKKVEGDRLMSAEAKRRRLDEIAAQKDAIAKRLATL